MSRTKAIKKKPVKKTVKKVAVKADPIKQLIDVLKNLGYTIEKYGTADNFFNYTLVKKNEKALRISFSVEILPYCCGIKEAGEFTVEDHTWADDVVAKDYKTITEVLTAIMFLECRKSNVSVKNRPHEKISVFKPVIFNSNGDDECIVFERAVKKYLKGYYKLVSKSVNHNSGSTIKTYISVM